jgi:ABC-type methionine transport system permease subunit
LIAGGAGAVAVKTGFLAKMWKVIVAAVLALKKVLIVAVIALAAAIKRLVSWLRGRREQTATSSE